MGGSGDRSGREPDALVLVLPHGPVAGLGATGGPESLEVRGRLPHGPAQGAPLRLRCEGLAEPLGLGEPAPRLSIARVEPETGAARVWTPPAGQHVSEAVFAPRLDGAGETDGWALVLVLVYDEASDASHCAVLDARAPEDGPVARAHFAHPVPLTLHGAWVPA